MIICASVFATFCNKYLQFLSCFWNQFFRFGIACPEGMNNCKVTGLYSFAKGLFQFKFHQKARACRSLCLSRRTPPPLPHLSFKKLPSPICKASTDRSLRVSVPVSFGQRNRPMGSCSPGLTVDSGLLRRCYKETPFKCEGGNIQL